MYALGLSTTTWLPDYVVRLTSSSSPRVWATAAYSYSVGSPGHLSAFLQLLLLQIARVNGGSAVSGAVVRSVGLVASGTVLLLSPGLDVPAWPGTVWDNTFSHHALTASGTRVGEGGQRGESCDLAFQASLKHVQPSAWAMLYVDLHLSLFLIPAGLAALARQPSPGAAASALAPEASALVGLCTAWSLFVAALQRSMAPAAAAVASVTSAVALLALLRPYLGAIRRAPLQLLRGHAHSAPHSVRREARKGAKNQDQDEGEEAGVGVLVVGASFLAVLVFVWHSTWATQFLYSSPALVVPGRTAEGARVALKDLEDAMGFLRLHTPTTARVIAWWEYGDAIAVVGNRSSVVDAQTCSCSKLPPHDHIHFMAGAQGAQEGGEPGARHPCAPCLSTVAQLLLSPAREAASAMERLGADYVVLVTGAYTGYQADDMNKLVAMLRLARCGASGHLWANKTAHYLVDGNVRVATAGTGALKDSLLFTLSYVGFGEVQTEFGRPKVLAPTCPRPAAASSSSSPPPLPPPPDLPPPPLLPPPPPPSVCVRACVRV